MPFYSNYIINLYINELSAVVLLYAWPTHEKVEQTCFCCSRCAPCPKPLINRVNEILSADTGLCNHPNEMMQDISSIFQGRSPKQTQKEGTIMQKEACWKPIHHKISALLSAQVTEIEWHSYDNADWEEMHVTRSHPTHDSIVNMQEHCSHLHNMHFIAEGFVFAAWRTPFRNNPFSEPPEITPQVWDNGPPGSNGIGCWYEIIRGGFI